MTDYLRVPKSCDLRFMFTHTIENTTLEFNYLWSSLFFPTKRETLSRANRYSYCATFVTITLDISQLTLDSIDYTPYSLVHFGIY